MAGETKPTAAAEASLVECTVARGRTVVLDTKAYNPGDTLKLPAEEAQRLTGLGYLVDTSVVAAPAVIEGPQVTQTA